MVKSVHSERQKLIVTTLAEQRRAKGMSQAELAKAFGRLQSFIASIESGERRVDLVELLTIADVLELDIHALIERPRAMPR
jgi:transcriptional regulator with XRE-family HTH domain